VKKFISFLDLVALVANIHVSNFAKTVAKLDNSTKSAILEGIAPNKSTIYKVS